MNRHSQREAGGVNVLLQLNMLIHTDTREQSWWNIRSVKTCFPPISTNMLFYLKLKPVWWPSAWGWCVNYAWWDMQSQIQMLTDQTLTVTCSPHNKASSIINKDFRADSCSCSFNTNTRRKVFFNVKIKMNCFNVFSQHLLHSHVSVEQSLHLFSVISDFTVI